MFTRISVPTPFQIGRVNAYVAGRTVVDPGPESEEAWSALLDGLEARNLVPGDVEQVLVTHPHPDHFGLASRLREAGARVLASETGAAIMADFGGRLEYEQRFFREFFERCGLSAETARTVTDLPTAFLPYAPDVETDRALTAGDNVTVRETTLGVDAVEGHAPGELVFDFEVDGQHRAVVGDNVLAHITPNPLLQPPAESGRPRPRVLPRYNDSLGRFREAGHDQLLPGHGDRIDDPAGRIDEILTAHEKRTGRVFELVEGPTVPADVMQGLFDDLPVTEQFSGLSEAVGHLDVLEARGKVRQRESGDVVVYERAGD
ncbi:MULTISPECIES: MBL fold metallo-hydrolase [Salinibaculum]|uniref:MBL fold metallo-hydrolase n=1 Tax=Salinibaculum TaxID=2732368 RepID=UPI0030D1AEC4